jgi:uncharacterized membrane protein
MTAMLRGPLRSAFTTWVAGLIVLLPLAITFAVLAWAFGLINRLLGPDSAVGRLFAWLGHPVARDSGFSYLVGVLLLFAFIYLLGLLARTSWHASLKQWLQRAVLRVPVLGPLYGTADRIVGLFGPKQGADITAMKPVWCSFGIGAAVLLALAPSGEPVTIDGAEYVAVLVPTAPVPIGGALIYVRMDSVKPADLNIEELTAVYVSMGLSPPVPRASQRPEAK